MRTLGNTVAKEPLPMEATSDGVGEGSIDKNRNDDHDNDQVAAKRSVAANKPAAKKAATAKKAVTAKQAAVTKQAAVKKAAATTKVTGPAAGIQEEKKRELQEDQPVGARRNAGRSSKKIRLDNE